MLRQVSKVDCLTGDVAAGVIVLSRSKVASQPSTTTEQDPITRAGMMNDQIKIKVSCFSCNKTLGHKGATDGPMEIELRMHVLQNVK